MHKSSTHHSHKVHSKEARKRLRRIIRHRMLRRVAEFFNRLPIGRQTKIAIVAIVVGILGGYGAIAFLYLIRLFQTIFFGGGGELLGILHRLPWYRVLFPPAIGGLIIGSIIYFLARETKGHGVPEVMEAVALKGGKMRSRIVFMKGLVASLFIGAGGSVGRVRPVVDSNKRMMGIIHFNELKEHLFDDSLPAHAVARDLAYKKYVTITPEENLLQAIKKFGTQDLEEIPVVSERDPARVVGSLSLTDVMHAYNKEVSRRMAE